MSVKAAPQRFRGTRKRLRRVRFSTADKWLAALLVLICLLAVAAGGWLGYNFKD